MGNFRRSSDGFLFTPEALPTEVALFVCIPPAIEKLPRARVMDDGVVLLLELPDIFLLRGGWMLDAEVGCIFPNEVVR